jgi:hypothetical protein
MSSAHSAHTTTTGSWRELASRDGNGLEVSLWWSKATGRVKVTVADTRRDEQFELDVEGAEALAAFHHPFAYAACERLSAGDAAYESVDLQPQR